MPLISTQPPSKYYEAASVAVRQLIVPSHGGGTMSPQDSNVFDLAAPHEVYTLDLSDVAKQSLKAAHRNAWRYLVMQVDDVVAAAEVQRPAKGGQPAFSHLNSGPFVQGSVKALEIAEKLKEVEGEDFHVRLLKVPALYVVALWLHGAERDLLIPLAPPRAHDGGPNTATPLTPNKPYTPDMFFQVLIPLAEQRSTFDDTPLEGKDKGIIPQPTSKVVPKKKGRSSQMKSHSNLRMKRRRLVAKKKKRSSGTKSG